LNGSTANKVSKKRNHPIDRGGLCYSYAESQNRTGDTLIFSQVLYQLSYLGSLGWIVLVALNGVKKDGVSVGIRIGRPDPTHFAHVSLAGRAPMPDQTAAWEPLLLEQHIMLSHLIERRHGSRLCWNRNVHIL
jgi:hypothetical protein